MSALKKFKGPRSKKAPVTRPMLLIIKQILDFEKPESSIIWAAIMTAFFLMCRSAEYCANKARGKFDMDKVFCRGSIRFFTGHEEIFNNFLNANKVVAKFAPKTKAGGGEERVMHATNEELCPVKALALMFERVPDIHKEHPLFSWPANSSRIGDGVRYVDVASLLKEAAVLAGVDPKTIGTHSIRRGAACSYLQSGSAYHSVKIYGRWASDCVREYVGVWDNMMCGAASRVARGFSDPNIRPTTALPPRE